MKSPPQRLCLRRRDTTAKPSPVPPHLSLTGYLGRKVCVGQAGAGEHRQLLAAYQRIQAVYCGNAGLYELVGVVPRGGVYGRAVDVQPLFGYGSAPPSMGLPMPSNTLPSISGATASSMEGWRISRWNRLCAVPDCPRRAAAPYPDLSQAPCPAYPSVGLLYLHQLVVLYAFYLIHQHKGAGNFLMVLYSLRIMLSPPSVSSRISALSFAVILIPLGALILLGILEAAYVLPDGQRRKFIEGSVL